jgi:hypothetical protein
MTIYEIKKRVTNAPFFFTTKSMKFFSQTLKSFKVRKLENGNFYIFAPHKHGFTEREFNPITNKFI